MDSSAVSLAPFVQRLHVHDPKYPVGRRQDLTWWPVDEIQALL